MGHPEVLTNLDWLELSTLPFELRPTNSIKLDDKGDVTENPLMCIQQGYQRNVLGNNFFCKKNNK